MSLSRLDTHPWRRATQTGLAGQSTEPVLLGDVRALVMLVRGSTFCVTSRTGDVTCGSPQGFFCADRRLLSELVLTLDGNTPDVLGAFSLKEASEAVFVLRPLPGPGQEHADLLILRRRTLAEGGLSESIELRNYGPEPATHVLRLTLAADFAHIFEVKEGRVPKVSRHWSQVSGTAMTFGFAEHGMSHEAVLKFGGPNLTVTPQAVEWALKIPAYGRHRVRWELTPTTGKSSPGVTGGRRSKTGRKMQVLSSPEEWTAAAPVVESAHDLLVDVFEQSIADLGALRLTDPRNPDRVVVAAGAPWFMTLFGRDSLLTAWMALPAAPALASGVLQTLAELQGTDVDPEADEQPGRIMHELRFGTTYFGSTQQDSGLGVPYYGSADATPLFVMLLAEYVRWTGDLQTARMLLPAADRALAWIEDFGDRDGDGFVEYQRAGPSGLRNQGWKDSGDAVRFADGRLARPPIALAEVQGYVYAAYRARAQLARWFSDDAIADRLDRKAGSLADAFFDAFWMPEHESFAFALDRDKRQVDTIVSNLGHCLWSGIVPPRAAGAVADRLLEKQMWSGWGIRTMSARELAYNPMSYHCGSVWPHDNALCAAGLARYGFLPQALRVVQGMLDAAESTGCRLPELFCGLDRADTPQPVCYPTSCSPQAWSAASPLLLLRLLLGLEPDAVSRIVRLSPHLPPEMLPLRVRRLQVNGGHLDISVGVDGRLSVDHAPAGIAVEVDAGPVHAGPAAT